jgi:hypothetical protein
MTMGYNGVIYGEAVGQSKVQDRLRKEVEKVHQVTYVLLLLLT